MSESGQSMIRLSPGLRQTVNTQLTVALLYLQLIWKVISRVELALVGDLHQLDPDQTRRALKNALNPSIGCTLDCGSVVTAIATHAFFNTVSCSLAVLRALIARGIRKGAWLV